MLPNTPAHTGVTLRGQRSQTADVKTGCAGVFSVSYVSH